MTIFFGILYLALFVFWLLLLGRIIVEFVRSLARDWHPSRPVAVVLEVIFSITDPPVKLLRRLIPQLSIGGIRLDLSIMVLMLAVFVLMQVVGGLAEPAGPV